MNIYNLDKLEPKLIDPENTWIAPGAHIIGSVEINSGVSVWFGSVIRGDNENIILKKNTNIQENSILHTDKGFQLIIGEGCTVGHSSILHGCIISSNTLIGMGSVLLNGSSIGENCIIGAGSLVVQNQVIPNGSLALGRPAKIVRKINKKEIKSIEKSAITYTKKIKIYQDKLRKISLK
ncbi:MAG: gamma carbonic anhydrase family protein [Paracoccaceae bacterium]